MIRLWAKNTSNSGASFHWPSTRFKTLLGSNTMCKRSSITAKLCAQLESQLKCSVLMEVGSFVKSVGQNAGMAPRLRAEQRDAKDGTVNPIDSSEWVECWCMGLDGSAPWRLSHVFVCVLILFPVAVGPNLVYWWDHITRMFHAVSHGLTRYAELLFIKFSHYGSTSNSGGYCDKPGANNNKGCELLSRQRHRSKVRKGNKTWSCVEDV